MHVSAVVSSTFDCFGPCSSWWTFQTKETYGGWAKLKLSTAGGHLEQTDSVRPHCCHSGGLAKMNSEAESWFWAQSLCDFQTMS